MVGEIWVKRLGDRGTEKMRGRQTMEPDIRTDMHTYKHRRRGPRGEGEMDVLSKVHSNRGVSGTPRCWEEARRICCQRSERVSRLEEFRDRRRCWFASGSHSGRPRCLRWKLRRAAGEKIGGLANTMLFTL